VRLWWDRSGDLALDDDGRLWRWDREHWRRLGPVERAVLPPRLEADRLRLLDARRAADGCEELVAEARSTFYAGLRR
jgi:hypothetical protein